MGEVRWLIVLGPLTNQSIAFKCVLVSEPYRHTWYLKQVVSGLPFIKFYLFNNTYNICKARGRIATRFLCNHFPSTVEMLLHESGRWCRILSVIDAVFRYFHAVFWFFHAVFWFFHAVFWFFHAVFWFFHAVFWFFHAVFWLFHAVFWFFHSSCQ